MKRTKRAFKSPKRFVGFDHVRSLSGGHEYTLTKNGLRVLLFPKHDVPVAVVMVTYHVGSRNEKPGTTGSTHILEHMMFKGSMRFDPKKNTGISDLIEATGATINATTWNDRTNYYSVVTTEHVDTAIRLEADRMKNLLIRDDDLKAEMVVVRNEYERGRNDPHRLLSSDLWSTAFLVHPYHYDTIGIKEDIEGITVEELHHFYKSFYWPNNATVSIIGDVDTSSVLKSIYSSFGHIQRHTIIQDEIPQEPKQEVERNFVLKRSGSVNALCIAYRIPNGRHPDSAALAVLSAHLAEGKGSVLHRALVDSSLASSVSVFSSRFYDPALLEFTVSLGRGIKHEKVLNIVDREVRRLSSGIISEASVGRARSVSTTRQLSYRSSLQGLSNVLNEAIALGDWTDVSTFTEKLERVKKADIVRVAKTYLRSDARSVGKLKST